MCNEAPISFGQNFSAVILKPTTLDLNSRVLITWPYGHFITEGQGHIIGHIRVSLKERVLCVVLNFMARNHNCYNSVHGFVIKLKCM